MNSPLNLTLDKTTFLHWAEGREGRFELKGSRVETMTGGSRNHARVIARLMGSLLRQIDAALWSVTASDLAVEIGEDIRYPDILAEYFEGEGAALSTVTPVFVAEVLSPSSLALDLNIKASEYMSLPSLEAYLVAAQDERRMWLWQRPAGDQGHRPFPRIPQEFFGPEAVLAIDAPGVSVPLAEIYAGIVLSA